MKKLLFSLLVISLSILTLPHSTRAAGGIYASGGGTKTVGQTFTVTVVASGADFDSLQGTVSVSGPVDIVSFSSSGATWLPGKSPANGKEFVGICSPTSSLTIITIKLRGNAVGSGNVSVSGVKIARNGTVTGTGAGGTSFTFQRALTPPGVVKVSSPTHPDPNTAYEATKVDLSWERDKGVDGFSYVFDTADGTVPPAKTTSNDTSISYADQAVGVYYFHIRSHNGDGWGSTTQFKVTIKEPDAKINDQLSKPHDIEIKKTTDFINNVNDGIVSGIIISGTTEPNYIANIKLTPTPTLPEGKTFSVQADAAGKFEYIIDFSIPTGFYKLTVQGQNNKILTPVSDEIKFEISQAKGGSINILTDTDRLAPIVPKLKWYEKTISVKIIASIVAALIAVIIIAIVLVKKRTLKKLIKSIKTD